MPYDLRQLTNSQLDRLVSNVWHRMTAGDGYQPFGWDAISLRLTKPGWWEAYNAILLEVVRRMHS